MPDILRLDYACTSAEREEAQSLSLRKQIGRGSKAVTHVILFLLLIGGLLGLYYQIRATVSAPWRPYAYAVTGLFLVGFVLWRRRSRKDSKATTRLEVSEKEITVLGPTLKVATPWSAFGECLESPTLFALVDRSKSTLLVLPKRVFPDERWQTWFRELARNRVGTAGPPPMESPVLPRSGSKDRVTVHFQLKYRDYLDRTVASCWTWAIFLFVAAVLGGTSLSLEAHPPPDAIYSGAQVFFLFEVPFLLVLIALLIPMFSFLTWRSHAKLLIPQQVAFGEESIEFASGDGSGKVPWTTYANYKETRWSFIIWKSRVAWLLVPKRYFASPDDIERFRALVGRRLQQSRWFFG